MKRLLLIALLMISTYSVLGQNNGFKPAVWRLTQLSGNTRLSGTYSQGTNILIDTDEQTQNSSLSAGLSLFTRSYIYHPNLLSLDISGGYEPKIQKYQAIVRPDYAINSSQKFINARAHLLKRLDYNVQGFFNFDENYANRENFSTIKSISKNLGGLFQWNNKFLPFTLNYSNSEQDQLEVETNRRLLRIRETIEAGSAKNYGENSQIGITLNRTLNTNEIGNEDYASSFSSQVDNLTLTNALSLAKNSNRILRSRLNYYNYKTDLNAQERFTLNNNFSTELGPNLELYSMYNYYTQNIETQSETNHKVFSSLTHDLYESLRSSFFIDYYIQNHSFFSQDQKNLSASFNYTKRIPLNGRLQLNYTYRNTLTDRQGEIAVVPVYNETYYVSDDQVNIIDNSDIDVLSLVVKDASGSLIFQEGIDYNLVLLGDFIEIHRIPGGLIANNTSVLLDYSFIQPSSFKLNNTAINYGIAIDLFTSTLQFYYNFASKKYDDPTQMPYLKLDFYDRQRYGAKFTVKSISGGIEYDDFNSNLVPFRLLNYYVSAKGILSQRLTYNVSYNKVDYLMLAEEGRTQQFDYINGNLFYYLSSNANLKLDLAYRSQKADAIDADWMTGRLSFNTVFNQLYIKAELNYYKRNFSGLDSNFAGASIQLTRKF